MSPIDWPEHKRAEVRRILRRAAQRMLEEDLEREKREAREADSEPVRDDSENEG